MLTERAPAFVCKMGGCCLVKPIERRRFAASAVVCNERTAQRNISRDRDLACVSAAVAIYARRDGLWELVEEMGRGKGLL